MQWSATGCQQHPFCGDVGRSTPSKDGMWLTCTRDWDSTCGIEWPWFIGDEQLIRRHSSWCTDQPNEQQQQTEAAKTESSRSRALVPTRKKRTEYICVFEIQALIPFYRLMLGNGKTYHKKGNRGSREKINLS